MRDFLADEDRSLLERYGLTSFEAIWRLELPAVDDPNVDRGGWSAVCRLNLDGRAFFLKRQCNHLTRSLRAPFGEPTFTREFRNFRRCRARNVAVAQVAFYAERDLPGDERCAILLTRALDGWRSMDTALEDARPGGGDRHRMLAACGVLTRRLHHAGFIHGCFYPRHIFVRKVASRYEACLIDLEKLRPLWFGTRDRVKDLEQFLRHCSPLATPEIHIWLSHYLDCAPLDRKIAVWIDRLRVRRRIKDAR